MQSQQQAGQTQTHPPQMKGPEMNDRDRLNDILAMEKYMSHSYGVAVNEASNDTLYQTQMSILTDIHQCQRDLFNLMHTKGWYRMDQANTQHITQAAQKFTNYQTQFPYQ
ncbi:spore coat protein [Kroppenstedtia eburnea]|uniref:spore coat protein n=1 Tax=Kroppenstedtia eburnea TaxID=714067 RepID=UPI00020C8996|nr:coat F domain protein [Desmospora sp. 8437]